MALNFAQKSGIRRHLDYPVAGLLQNSPAGGSLGSAFVGYRFLQAYGRLEWKMNNLNPDEEARLVGLGYAACALVGPNPNAGDQISVTLSGGNITSPQVVSAAAQAGDNQATFISRLAANAALNTVLQAAEVNAVAPFGTGPFNQMQVPLAEVAFTSPVGFTIGTPTSTGVLFPQITASGSQLAPSSQIDGVNTYWGYLAILDALEGAWAATSQNLDTMAAGPWKARANEAGQRLSLYRNWQERLSKFLEIPIFEGNETGTGKAKYTGALRFA